MYYSWLIVCSILVFLMQIGFACLETGMASRANAVKVAVKNASDFPIALFIFWLISYSAAFGSSFPLDLDLTLFGTFKKTLELPEISKFLYQAMFIGTAVTILSGAVLERLRYKAFIFITIYTSLISYPLFVRLAWNGTGSYDFLSRAGFKDFAGSTVVHSLGGWIALAAILVLGPRKERFGPKGEVREVKSYSLGVSVIGMLLLWIGWLGFNGGSVPSFDRDLIFLVLLNTFLGGAAGFLSLLLVENATSGFKPSPSALINGPLAGLVGVTASADIITPFQAILIGSSSALIAALGSRILLKLRIDDCVDAVPVHLFAGIWGTLLGPVISYKAEGLGISLTVQLYGIFVCFATVFVPSYVFLKILNFFFPIGIAGDKRGFEDSAYESEGEDGTLSAQKIKIPKFPKYFTAFAAILVCFSLGWITYETESVKSGIGAIEAEYIEKIPSDYKKNFMDDIEGPAQILRQILAGSLFIFTALCSVLLVLGKNIRDWKIALEEALKKAEESDRVKSSFIANISHEFKTPLNAVIGITELLMEDLGEDGKNSKYVESLGRVEKAGKGLAKMVENILDLISLESKTVKLSVESFGLDRLLNEIKDFCEKEAGKNDNKIKFLTPERNISMETDFYRLKTIILNLAENSCSFTKKGEIEISFASSGENLKITVSDTGIGFSEELLEKTFSSILTQGDMSLGKKYKGIGVGLSIVKRSLDLLGGEIEVKSEQGKYTKVTCLVPRKLSL